MDKLVEWLTFADYDAAKRDTARRAVRRYSRGNVALQHGLYLTQEDLDKMRVQGDRAHAEIMKDAVVAQ